MDPFFTPSQPCLSSFQYRRGKLLLRQLLLEKVVELLSPLFLTLHYINQIQHCVYRLDF